MDQVCGIGFEELFFCLTTNTPSNLSVVTSRRKRVLAVQYSQTGQLAAVMDALLAPLSHAAALGEIELVREVLSHAPGHEYPYPWPFWRFLDTFPETVAGDAPPLAPLGLRGDEQFDLVIIGYPVWFLSPPPAISAFFRGEVAGRILHGRPVVTVTACRNMWLMAQEKIRELLGDAGARHCDHVALTDQGSALATFITTPRWLLTGRKGGFCGLPPAGITAERIAGCARFGRAILRALERDEERVSAPMLAGLRACEVDSRLIASERVGIRSFRIWSKFLRACGRPGTPVRRVALFGYTCFLLMMIITFVPVSMLIKALLRPFLRAKFARLKTHYEQPSGSGDERLASFSTND